MSLTLNLTADEIKDAQGGNFQPLAAGTYGAVIYECELKESKAGNPMYVIDYKITEGPEGINRKIRSWYAITPKALFIINRLLKATGFPHVEKNTAPGEFTFPDPDEFLGIDVNIKIDQESYQTVGDDNQEVTAYRNNVKNVFEYDPDKIDQPEDGDSPSAANFL